MKRMDRHCNIVLWTVMLFFYIPIAVLVVNSFNQSKFSGAWEGFTFKWYAMLFEDRDLWQALLNTLKVAFGSTAVSVVLGTTAALALHRWKGRIQTFHYGLIYTHLVLPDILMGISLLLFFIAIGLDQSLFTVFLAHTTFCLSYVAMAVLGRLQDFDSNLLEAARDLGANTWTAFWRVQFPLLLPGIVAGGLLAYALDRRLRHHLLRLRPRLRHAAGEDLRHDQAQPAPADDQRPLHPHADRHDARRGRQPHAPGPPRKAVVADESQIVIGQGLL